MGEFRCKPGPGKQQPAGAGELAQQLGVFASLSQPEFSSHAAHWVTPAPGDRSNTLFWPPKAATHV